MSMVNSPPVNYRLLKRPDESGLSDLQYETVARICQRNSGFLPQTNQVGPAERAGFLLGKFMDSLTLQPLDRFQADEMILYQVMAQESARVDSLRVSSSRIFYGITANMPFG